jgi:arylsulfatase A-like enzyme
MFLAAISCPQLVAEDLNAGNAKKPNIIYIMSDDHASHAIGAYGSKFIKTPNLDRLAKESMRFTNCFNVNSLCAPSRAAMITGRYTHHNGVFKNGDKFDGSQMTFPKLLQKAGYKTGLIGKWHLSSQPTGFDDYSILRVQGKYFDC